MRRAEHQATLESNSILVTFGLLFVIQNLAFLSFGADRRYSYLSDPVEIMGSV